MSTTRALLAAAFAYSCFAGTCAAQNVETVSGGSIQTKLSPSIILNSLSSLQRIWIVVRDPSLPAELVGTPGVKTIYTSKGSYSGSYQYAGNYSIRATADLTAVQVKYLVFDVWGQHRRSLVADEIEDIPAGKVREYKPRWNLHSESDASTHYASIAYIAKIRTADNKVYSANLPFVIEQAKKFSAKFEEADLEPDRKTK